jgi:hypothetical protein
MKVNRTFAALVTLGMIVMPEVGLAEEPPVGGRPLHFDGAIGSFKIATRAEPTQLQAEDPLILTVQLTASGPASQAPKRPDLRRWPDFARRFQIDDLSAQDASGAYTWEFRYRLKPRNAEVKAIPALRFDYYKPGVVPREKGYRATYAPAIPLIVKPRGQVQVAEVEGTPATKELSDAVLHLADGAAVLRRSETDAVPNKVLGAVLVLVPPMICAAWYAGWRRRYPDAACQARLRQSRAARQALRGLTGARAPEAAAVMAHYLRERFDLAAVEPTPAEVVPELIHKGCAVAHAERIAAFFRACDTARFAPDLGPPGDELAATAARVILELERRP